MKTALAPLRALLVADMSVQQIVGTRVYAGRVEQGAELPNVVLQVVSSRGSDTLDGVTTPEIQRVQVTCRANSLADADNLGAAVDSAINNYQGVISGVEVQGVLRVSDNTVYDDESAVVRRIIDYRVAYR